MSPRFAPVLLCALTASLAAAGPSGSVQSGGQAIPGAQVTAVQGETERTVYTDEQGRYGFDDLGDGEWTVRVEMFGFAPVEQAWRGSDAPLDWRIELESAPPPEVPRRLAQRLAAPGGAGRGRFQRVAVNVADQVAAMEAQAFNTQGLESEQLIQSASESYLVNGSVSRGLDAPPMAPGFGRGRPGGPGGIGGGPGGFGGPDSGTNIFSQAGGEQAAAFEGPGGPGGPGGGPGRFGGGRGGPGGGRGGGGPRAGGGGPGGRGGPGAGRGPRGPGGREIPEFLRQRAAMIFGNRANRGQTPIRGNLSFDLRNSAFDATPYSITGEQLDKPSYAQSNFSASVGGQLKIPKLVTDTKTFWFFTYRGSRARNPFSAFATMPSARERAGDFSQSIARDPVSIYDRTTGEAFVNNQVPQSRLDPAALGLAELIPAANLPGNVRNYQFISSVPRNSDAFSVRLNRSVTAKDRLSFTYNARLNDQSSLQLYGFEDTTNGKGQSAALAWTRNIKRNIISNARFNFSRDRNETLPFFAFGDDIAGELGIAGASRNPINYGPPNVTFTNFGDLRDGAPSERANTTFSIDEGLTIVKGDHTVRFGGTYRRMQINTISEQDARGTFSFSGVATSAFNEGGLPVPNTGFDFADFLLGLPQSSSIRFGNPDTYFRASAVNAYLQDDWRISSGFSINYGMRYEYQPPFREKYGRLANLDVAPGFADVAPVLSRDSGAFTGVFPEALIESDTNNFSPRFGMAWKPWSKRSTTVRGGYGMYYNGSVYNQAASRLAQQPPFSVTTALVTGVDNLLTLANGFAASPDASILNSFAVARRYRVGYAQTWNFSVQHNLPGSMVLSATYLGTKGTRLDIQRSPNRTAAGLTEGDRQIADAVGFVYDSAEGNSIYHAGQVRLIRRFRRGISGNLQYTWAKSIDNVSSFGGGGGAVVALYDDNLALERGLSSFDVRHTLSAGWVWSSPISQGVFGPPPKHWWQRLLKSWTLTGSIAGNTGTPLTAQVLGNQANSAGSGVVGSGRADATGLPVTLAGAYFNPLAFTTPASGELGNAGRNTIPGPGTFSVNFSVGRSFRLDDNRRSIEIRASSANFLNNVNIQRLATTVNSSNFGLPTAAGDMRTITLSLRVRF